jgi:hypothetical protein
MRAAQPAGCRADRPSVNVQPRRALRHILQPFFVRVDERMNRISWAVVFRTGAQLAVSAAFGALVPCVANAEIYAWVDPSGDVTYSNLPPPKNARVFAVIEETAPPTPQQQAAADAAHQSEMRALNDRVQQLEREMQQSRWESEPPAPYPVAAAPYPPPPPGYGAGCDSEYLDCDMLGGPVYYTAGVPLWWGQRPHREGFHQGFHHSPHPGRPLGGPRVGGFSGHAGRMSGGFSGGLARSH